MRILVKVGFNLTACSGDTRDNDIVYESSAARSARQCEAYLLQLPSLSCWMGWPNYQTATRPPNVQTTQYGEHTIGSQVLL